jgi:tRNA_anti-like
VARWFVSLSFLCVLALGCSRNGGSKESPVSVVPAVQAQTLDPRPLVAPKSSWPAEPAPSLANDSQAFATAKAELEGNKFYRTLWDPKTPKGKRDEWLSQVGHGIAALDPEMAQSVVKQVSGKGVEQQKEQQKVLEAFNALAALVVVVSVEGKLPDEFSAKARARIESGAQEEHLGLWSKDFDLTALAVFLYPGNTNYLRALIDAKASGLSVGWEGDSKAFRPWLSRELDALELLAAFTPLNAKETEQLALRRASKLGHDVAKANLEKLLATYKSNEVRGDDTYKGLAIEVRGTVHEIAKDAFGSTFLRMGSPGLTGGFHCKVNPAFLKGAAKINGGSVATVRGRVVGFVMKSVVAEDCEVH